MKAPTGKKAQRTEEDKVKNLYTLDRGSTSTG